MSTEVNTIYYGYGTMAGIMQNLYDGMVAIPGVGAAPLLKYVDYQRAYDQSITPDKFPGCFLTNMREDKVELLRDIVKNTATVVIAYWVMVQNNANLWLALDTLENSIRAVIHGDHTRGNNALDCEITQSNTDAGSRYPIGVAAIFVKVTYFSET